jgi:S1-C subfamily serine protease
MMVMAGGNHIRFGFGIPRRVFRRLPTSYTLVGSKEIIIPEEKQKQLMDVEIPGFPMPPYDFVVFTAYESLEKQKVRLGVMLQEKDGSVQVEKVLPGSVAEKSGVQAGDVLVSFDGEPVKDSLDVIYAVKEKQTGDRAVLEIARDGVQKTLEVLFVTNGENDNP